MRWGDRPTRIKDGSRQGVLARPAPGRLGPPHDRMVRIPRPANDNRQAADRRLPPRLLIQSLIVLTLLALALSRALDLF